MRTIQLAVLSLAATAAWAQQPVETGTYLTGAWGWRNATSPESRALYLNAGFNLSRYDRRLVEWAERHDMRFIASVSGRGMPKDVARPFEAQDGSRANSVGLFTHVNFNASSVVAWWQERVPELVRAMPGAERVAFWKVHNEFGYHSGRIYDYSPGTVTCYRAWLRERYDTLAGLNRQWRTAYDAFDEIEPPRDRFADQLPNWLEWRRFTCWNFGDYFRSTGDLIRTVAPGARVSDNFYPTSPLDGWDLFDLARQTDYLALDIYAVGRWPQLLEKLDLGRCAGRAAGKPFTMMEYHAGPNHWAPVVHGRDLLIEANVALARECRSLMWFLWQPASSGRELGIHGMLDTDGNPTERTTAAAQVSAFTARLAPLLARTQVQADVAVVTSYDNVFLARAEGTDQWRGRRRWNNLGHALDAARVQFDFIDVATLQHGDLSSYRVLVLGELPVMPEKALQQARSFAERGGTVVVHPGVGGRDRLGHAREPGAFHVDPAPAPAPDAEPVFSVTRTTAAGKGRIVHCAQELPDRYDDPDLICRQGQAYAAMLAQRSAVRPALRITAAAPANELDARRLSAGGMTVVLLTYLGEGTVRDVEVDLPGLSAAAPALLLRPETAAVSRLQTRKTPTGIAVTVPGLNPSACLLLGTNWQPLVGIDAPQALHPGEETLVTVTVDNCGRETVAGSVYLNARVDWTVEPKGQVAFSGLAPGARAAVRFAVSLPADARIDRFALDSQLLAQVTFSEGRTGVLTTRHLPFVRPRLDVALISHDMLLNPWQQLTPPILRWGWHNERHTPPPPPIAFGAPAEAVLELASVPTLSGTPVHLSVTGPGPARIVPERSALVSSGDGTQSVPVRFELSAPGEHILHVRAGNETATVTFQSGVEAETVLAPLKLVRPAAPAGWEPVALLGVGARGAPAKGVPAEFPVALSDEDAARAAVFSTGANGAMSAVAATVVADSATVCADVPQDAVRTYVLAVARPGLAVPTPRRVHMGTEGARATVTGDCYSVVFDSDLGLVESMTLAGRPAVRHRTGVVATRPDGSEWAPDGRGGASGLAFAASPVACSLELTRALGPSGSGCEVEEKWQFEAGQISVALRIANRGQEPLAFSRIVYEIGVDPEHLPHWQQGLADGRRHKGTSPAAIGTMAGVEWTDWFDESGRGLAVTLGRCAQNMKWASIANSVRHSPARTEIQLVNGVSIDPGDFILAEFELWPHADAAVVPERAVLVTESLPLR